MNHILIYVQDLQRSIHFYRDLLGLKMIEEIEGYARLRLQVGDTTIGLHTLTEEVPSLPSSEGMRLYFEVESLDQLCSRLQSEGVKFDKLPEDMPWGWRHAYLKDPDSHLISFFWAGEKRLQKSE